MNHEGLRGTLNIPDTLSTSATHRAIINAIIAPSSLRTLTSPGLRLRRSGNHAEKISPTNICDRVGIHSPRGPLEAERLSLMRLNRCVIHSAPGFNNAVRKGTCYRIHERLTGPADPSSERRGDAWISFTTVSLRRISPARDTSRYGIINALPADHFIVQHVTSWRIEPRLICARAHRRQCVS